MSAQKQLCTSYAIGGEAFWSTRFALPGLVLVGVAPFLFAVDVNVAWLAREGFFPRWLVKAAHLSEFYAHGFGVVIIAWLIATLGDSALRGVATGATALGAGLVADLAKLVVFRVRPRDFDFSTSVWGTFQDWLPVFTRDITELSSSFPSSHAATAAGVTVALVVLFPRGTPVFIVLFALACLQRLVAGAHFPSDIAFGAGLGWCAGWLIIQFLIPRAWLRVSPES